MNILVFNCGSSSLNYKLYRTDGENNLTLSINGKAHRVGTKGTEPAFIEHKLNGKIIKNEVELTGHRQAAQLILEFLRNHSIEIDIIGHRFVHGGQLFHESVVINPETSHLLEECLPLAPIHNPNSWGVIKECQTLLPDKVQYVTFDTAFHAQLEPHVYTYAIPRYLREDYGLRKYGFHGLSYQYISHAAPKILGIPSKDLKMVVCHLGTGGSSVAAIKDGHSIDTSMGFSPTSGLIMSTRCGDIDPSIPIFLAEKLHYSSEKISRILNKESGLLGVSEVSSDIRDLFKLYETEGNNKALLAIKMYTHQLLKYIGSFIALLNGIDALVFTDDVGVQCNQLREMICDNLAWYGVKLDQNLNRNHSFDQAEIVSHRDSKVKVLSMPTDEEFIIGIEGINLFN